MKTIEPAFKTLKKIVDVTGMGRLPKDSNLFRVKSLIAKANGKLQAASKSVNLSGEPLIVVSIKMRTLEGMMPLISD